IPEAEWSQKQLTSGVWTIFPHVSIAGFVIDRPGPDPTKPLDTRLQMISQLLPGPDQWSSVTVQHFLAPFEPTAEEQAVIEEQMAFLLRVVRDEDYSTGLRIQKALRTGAKDHLLFGRNESGGQRFHRWVDAIVAAESDAELAELYQNAEVVHQP
ncbi:MAG: hypothetical protein HKN26_02950, partial [Acidimicrobiales bacterium]|nr:hypothetical protein [Acidimicrobiales bacterium]